MALEGYRHAPLATHQADEPVAIDERMAAEAPLRRRRGIVFLGRSHPLRPVVTAGGGSRNREKDCNDNRCDTGAEWSELLGAMERHDASRS